MEQDGSAVLRPVQTVECRLNIGTTSTFSAPGTAGGACETRLLHSEPARGSARSRQTNPAGPSTPLAPQAIAAMHRLEQLKYQSGRTFHAMPTVEINRPTKPVNSCREPHAGTGHRWQTTGFKVEAGNATDHAAWQNQTTTQTGNNALQPGLQPASQTKMGIARWPAGKPNPVPELERITVGLTPGSRRLTYFQNRAEDRY